MAYDIQKAIVGRKPQRRISIGFKKCGLEYGKNYTNLLLYSEEFDHASWGKHYCTIVSNATEGLDGTYIADKVVFDGTYDPWVTQSYTASLANKTFTVSVWLWTDAGQPTSFKIYLYGNVGLENLVSQDIELTATPTRYDLTIGFGASPSSISLVIRFDGAEGITPAAGEYHYIWGAQLVEGNMPGHYVATTSSSASLECQAENAKANLLKYSEQFDNANWGKTKCSITSDATTSPIGTLTADKVVFDGTIDPFVTHAYTASLANKTFTVSVWLWTDAGQPTSFKIYLYGNVGLENLVSQDIELTATPTRYDLTIGFGASPSSTALVIRFDGAEGITPAAGEYHYIWGAQLVEGSNAGIYYQTEATAYSGTAGAECYNTRHNCQDVANYTRCGYFNVALCEETVEPQFDLGAIPCIKSIGTAHTEIAPGQDSIGKRAGIGIQCTDFPHHDIGFDPYVSGRSYTPMQQGTFFGKLKARHPYYQDAIVAVETGYLTEPFDSTNFKTKTYFLEKFEGPDKNGQVQFVAQDIMRRLDDERATCPTVTVGKLTAGLAAGTTSNFIVSGDADKYATGGGAVRVNDEIIEYASGTDNGDGTFIFSTLTRGADGTTADDHDADDAVQMCVDFTAQYPRDIAYTLYNTYAEIPGSYLNTTQWDSIADTWLQVTYTRRITKPTSVKKLLGEAHQQMGFVTWWDEENASIKLEAIRPPDYGAISTYSEGTHFDRGSVEIKEKTDLRVTQVHFYYHYKNPIDIDKPEHFQRRVRNIDAGAESADQHGDSRIKEVYAAWVRDDNTAVTTSSRLVNRFRDNIRVAHFNLDAKDEGLNTGDQCYLEHSAIQDEAGAAKPTLFQIVQRDEIESGHKYAYRAWELFFFGRYARIGPAGLPNYGSATDEQKGQYSWICGAGGSDFADGGGPYKVL